MMYLDDVQPLQTIRTKILNATMIYVAIAAEHGGHMTVESAPGIGATVIVHLPIGANS